MDGTPSDYDEKVYSEGAVEWQRRRAGRRSLQETEARLDYAPIVFPPTAECRHAALVVCSNMVSEPDPVAAAREILEALALPTIIRLGGDGRALKVAQKSNKKRAEPLPIGYGEDDFGRPSEKPRSKKRTRDGSV